MSSSRQAAGISIILNFALTGAKLVVGLVSGSMALMAEALHSCADIFSSFVAYWGIHLGQKAPDKEHPWGHARYENLSSLVIVLFLALTSFAILYEAGRNLLLNQHQPVFTQAGLVVMALSGLINWLASRWKFRIGSQGESLALISDAKHSEVDALTSFGILIGLYLVKFYPSADNILALAIAVYILFEAIKIGRESIDALTDKRDAETEEKIKAYLNEKEIEFSFVRTRRLGMNVFAEIEIQLPSSAKVAEAEEISRRLEDELMARIDSLEQVTILVRSHKISHSGIQGAFGRRMYFRSRFNFAKPLRRGSQRIAIPIENDEIADHFGVQEFLLVEMRQGKVIRRERIKNDFYQQGQGRGVRFLRSQMIDELWTKEIGPGAKNNLAAWGIKLKILPATARLKDLNFKKLK